MIVDCHFIQLLEFIVCHLHLESHTPSTAAKAPQVNRIADTDSLLARLPKGTSGDDACGNPAKLCAAHVPLHRVHLIPETAISSVSLRWLGGSLYAFGQRTIMVRNSAGAAFQSRQT
jgi:hypothetical protein